MFKVYLFLAVSIFCEIIATNLLKASAGFTKPMASIGAIVLYVICFYSLSKAMNYIPLNVVYALWAAIGIVVISLVGVFFWHEAINIPTIIGIGLIVVGTVLVNIYGAGH
jgi:small multidrug resistance pump